MYLLTAAEKVYQALKNCEALSNCVIIKAYPYAKKPTRLRRTFITVSPAEAEVKNTALGGNSLYGKFSVSIDVFAPQESGTPVENGVTDGIVSAVLPLEPAEIKIGSFTANDDLSSFCAKCLLTFSSDIIQTQEDGNG